MRWAMGGNWRCGASAKTGESLEAGAEGGSATAMAAAGSGAEANAAAEAAVSEAESDVCAGRGCRLTLLQAANKPKPSNGVK